MGVTTTHRAGLEAVGVATAVAARYGWPYCPRQDRPLCGPGGLAGAGSWLVVGNSGAELVQSDGRRIPFHPGLAVVRIKRLLAGGADPLVTVAGLREGDTFLDCTLGLAQDAVVAAHAVGEKGRVLGLEAVPEVAALIEAGLAMYRYPLAALEAAMRRVEVEAAAHAEVLAALPDRSWDVVYFDPMFRQPVAQAAGIAPLRAVACAAPLNPQTIREARRVAKRSVVVKERRGSPEFDRLGLRVVWEGSRVALGVC